MQSVLLTSESPLKLRVIKDFFPPDGYTITCIDSSSCGLPAQPVDCAFECAKIRLDRAKEILHPKTFDYYVSIENGVETSDLTDVCSVIIEHNNISISSVGIIRYPIRFNHWEKLQTHPTVIKGSISGYDKTIGDIVHEENPTSDPKNWVLTIHNLNREDQIRSSIGCAMVQLCD